MGSPENALRDKGEEQSWKIFKEVFHKAQELEIPRSKRLGRKGKRLAWLHRELLARAKIKCHGSKDC